MPTIIRKAFWDHEKEENWLNEQSAKGLALTNYAWCKYTFTPCQPNEYTYRLELLDQLTTHPKSQEYLQFITDSGIEHVASYSRWVYFRRPTIDGAFDIYSDTASKIQHYRRIQGLWITLALAELAIGLSNICLSISAPHNLVNLIMGIFCIGIGLPILGLSLRLQKKIKQLRKDSTLTE